MIVPYHRLWFSEEQERWRRDLGIENLSEYVRDKMRGDVDRGVSLAALRTRLEAVDEERARLEAAFRAKAVQVEGALHAFEAAAAEVRARIAVNGVSVQSSIWKWVENHPRGRELRRHLPRGFATKEVVEILLQWPESRPELVRVLSQEGPPGLGGGADEPRGDDAARGEARASR